MAGAKKVLFITYYWPPAGGATVARILKFYKYLPEFGWEPVILTVDKGDFVFIDESLSAEVRKDSKIYRSKNIAIQRIFNPPSKSAGGAVVPYMFTDKTKLSLKGRFSRWIKFNMIPDTRILWKSSAVKAAMKITRDEKIDLIFSSSPPQTNHLIARKVSEKTGIPWVGDFRDPWTDVFWLHENSLRWKWIHNIDKKIERKTMAGMKALVTVSPSLVEIISAKTKVPVHLIYNGFDDEAVVSKTRGRNEKFTLAYAGSLSYEQKPDAFFDALDKLSTNEEFRTKSVIKFIGNFPPYLHEMIDKSLMKPNFVLLPYTTQQEAIQHISTSDLVLLVIPKTSDNAGIVTSKLFDYLGTQRPILAYGPMKGDANTIIEQAGAGKMFTYDDGTGSTEFIMEQFSNWKNGKEFVYKITDTDRYSRRKLAGKLAEVFESALTFKEPL